MNELIWILLGTFAVSIMSIIGIFTLFLNEKIFKNILLLLVGLSAGAMMGGAFFHLLPEAVERISGILPFVLVLGGFIIFFLVEKILHWHHCHNGVCSVHTFGYMNVIGDGIHNFIDGLIVAAAFLVDINLGLVTVLAIALHEIPQEISDFGVLVYSGFGKIKSLVLNYISASTVIIGGLTGYFLGGDTDFIKYILPFAAGGFIYIASSDLLPEIKKEEKMSKFLPSFTLFIIGLLLMYLLLFLGL